MGRVYYSSALELYPYAIHARAWEHEVKLEFGTTVRTVFVSGAEDTSRVRDRSGRDRSLPPTEGGTNCEEYLRNSSVSPLVKSDTIRRFLK